MARAEQFLLLLLIAVAVESYAGRRYYRGRYHGRHRKRHDDPRYHHRHVNDYRPHQDTLSQGNIGYHRGPYGMTKYRDETDVPAPLTGPIPISEPSKPVNDLAPKSDPAVGGDSKPVGEVKIKHALPDINGNDNKPDDIEPVSNVKPGLPTGGTVNVGGPLLGGNGGAGIKVHGMSLTGLGEQPHGAGLISNGLSLGGKVNIGRKHKGKLPGVNIGPASVGGDKPGSEVDIGGNVVSLDGGDHKQPSVNVNGIPKPGAGINIHGKLPDDKPALDGLSPAGNDKPGHVGNIDTGGLLPSGQDNKPNLGDNTINVNGPSIGDNKNIGHGTANVDGLFPGGVIGKPPPDNNINVGGLLPSGVGANIHDTDLAGRPNINIGKPNYNNVLGLEHSNGNYADHETHGHGGLKPEIKPSLNGDNLDPGFLQPLPSGVPPTHDVGGHIIDNGGLNPGQNEDMIDPGLVHPTPSGVHPMFPGDDIVKPKPDVHQPDERPSLVPGFSKPGTNNNYEKPSGGETLGPHDVDGHIIDHGGLKPEIKPGLNEDMIDPGFLQPVGEHPMFPGDDILKPKPDVHQRPDGRPSLDNKDKDEGGKKDHATLIPVLLPGGIHAFILPSTLGTGHVPSYSIVMINGQPMLVQNQGLGGISGIHGISSINGIGGINGISGIQGGALPSWLNIAGLGNGGGAGISILPNFQQPIYIGSQYPSIGSGGGYFIQNPQTIPIQADTNAVPKLIPTPVPTPYPVPEPVGPGFSLHKNKNIDWSKLINFLINLGSRQPTSVPQVKQPIPQPPPLVPQPTGQPKNPQPTDQHYPYPYPYPYSPYSPYPYLPNYPHSSTKSPLEKGKNVPPVHIGQDKITADNNDNNNEQPVFTGDYIIPRPQPQPSPSTSDVEEPVTEPQRFTEPTTEPAPVTEPETQTYAPRPNPTQKPQERPRPRPVEPNRLPKVPRPDEHNSRPEESDSSEKYKPRPGEPDKSLEKHKPRPEGPDNSSEKHKTRPEGPDNSSEKHKPHPGEPKNSSEKHKPHPGEPDNTSEKHKPRPGEPDNSFGKHKPRPEGPDNSSEKHKQRPEETNSSSEENKRPEWPHKEVPEPIIPLPVAPKPKIPPTEEYKPKVPPTEEPESLKPAVTQPGYTKDKEPKPDGSQINIILPKPFHVKRPKPSKSGLNGGLIDILNVLLKFPNKGSNQHKNSNHSKNIKHLIKLLLESLKRDEKNQQLLPNLSYGVQGEPNLNIDNLNIGSGGLGDLGELANNGNLAKLVQLLLQILDGRSEPNLNVLVQPGIDESTRANLILLLNRLANNLGNSYQNAGYYQSGNPLLYFLGHFPCDHPNISAVHGMQSNLWQLLSNLYEHTNGIAQTALESSGATEVKPAEVIEIKN